MKQSNLVNLLIVSEKPEHIDFAEKALKAQFTLNRYQSNHRDDIEQIIQNEVIEIVVTDDEKNTTPLSVLKDLFKKNPTVPIIQLIDTQKSPLNELPLNQEADFILANNDAYGLRASCQVLLNNIKQRETLIKNEALITSYQNRFDNLYKGITDPICYLHDGVFVDCNPAFLRHFEISEKSDLDELTILSFVDKRAFTDFRSLLRKATRIDLSASPAVFSMHTAQGKPVEFSVMCRPARVGEEKVVQVYMRPHADTTSGSSLLFDETTGLANKHQFTHFLKEQIKQFSNQPDGIGTLTYLFIKNYRDIWSSDGLSEAEKFIKATVSQVRKLMPAHTEISRYTDDGLILYSPNKSPEQIESTLEKLLSKLDITPEGMKRMVEPVCYVGYEALTEETDHETLISQTFRSARNAALTNATSHINRVVSVEVSKKDNKRVSLINTFIKESLFTQHYQPIAGFTPDGINRYQVLLGLPNNEKQHIELNVLVNTAERYKIMRQIDQWQLQHLFNQLLSTDTEKREKLRLYVPISADSLKSTHFTSWLMEQLSHTGLPAQQFVFELTVDNIHNAYSGALTFSKTVKAAGGRVAIVGLSNLSEMAERVIADISPDALKIDIREIDTLDDNETDELMNKITQRAEQLNAFVVADHMESPAQLSKVWPYDIKFIQGDGMTPTLTQFDFNFDDFAI